MAKKISNADKQELRSRILGLKFSASKKRKASSEVCRKISRSLFFRDAVTIGFYAATPDEVDLSRLAVQAIKLGKKIFFPRVRGKKLEFRQVQDLKSDLQCGAFKIYEPHPKRTAKRTRALDLVLVPGRAFDASGSRLGRGFGYYDRLLANWKKSVRLGVCFREQKVKQVPVEKHDIRMDAVVTG